MKKGSCLLMLILAVLISTIITGCCKDKNSCKKENISISPFVERFAKFECNNNNEYTYILRRKAQLDTLEPNCYIINSIAFPIDETDYVYIMVGRTFEHYKDTFQTTLWKDTCSKKLIYEVNRIQRDTTRYCCPYGVTAVTSMFCAVENIPADYKIEVKYKYVPLGE